MRNFVVTIDGKQYQVAVEEVSSGTTAMTQSVQPVAAAPKAAPVTAPQPAPAPAAQPAPAAAPQGGTQYKAPMPGMVKKLAVANGSRVKKGDVIIVLEAMKMDNDLNAPCDGTVTFMVSEGANVDSGAVRAVIA